MDRKSILQENKLFIPATPDLKRLGYGTGQYDIFFPSSLYSTKVNNCFTNNSGVGIFHVSPRNGVFNSPWALKKLLRGTKCNQTIMGERLRNEANILRKLNHPNIVGFRAFLKTSDGRECLAMEECHTSLADIIEDQEGTDAFPVHVIEKVAIEVAKALDYIHNTVYLLHGDIKSPNILIKGLLILIY